MPDYGRALYHPHAVLFVKQLCKSVIKDQYPEVRGVHVSDRYFGGSAGVDDPSGTISVLVGTGSFEEAFEHGGFVRDIDVMRVAWTAFHEARHVEQIARIFTKEDLSGFELDMCRAHAISSAFPSYYESSYSYLPYEVDASAWATEHAADYVDAFLWDGDGRRAFDAKVVLVQALSEMPVAHCARPFSDFDGLRAFIAERMAEYPHRDHRADFHPHRLDFPCMAPIYEAWAPVLEACPSPGLAQDEVLLGAALDARPDLLAYYPGLAREAERVRAMYPPLAKPEPGPEDEHPASYDASGIDLSGIRAREDGYGLARSVFD